jgi:excisionase family DNA binding protein
MEKLWTTAEVARFLGVNEVDVEALVREGQLTGYKLGGEFLRFRPDQVKAVKVRLRPRPSAAPPPAARTWMDGLKDFIYFYDFYLVSAGCLAMVILYLIASG